MKSWGWVLVALGVLVVGAVVYAVATVKGAKAPAPAPAKEKGVFTEVGEGVDSLIGAADDLFGKKA